MSTGWVLYACLNPALLIHMALRETVVVREDWNELAIEEFMGLVRLPVAFAFSVRMFGRFERLVYAAHTLLVMGMGVEVILGLAILIGNPFDVSSSAIRHMYLLGFITLLIFGMAVRMPSCLWHKRQVSGSPLSLARSGVKHPTDKSPGCQSCVCAVGRSGMGRRCVSGNEPVANSTAETGVKACSPWFSVLSGAQ